MKADDFIKDLEIDRHQLDKELIKQPQLFTSWALECAEASEDKDQARKDLDLVRADAESNIRINIEKYKKKYNTDKITEAIIKAEITLNSKVKKYNNTYLKSLHRERVLTKIEKAFSHRKASLEGLVQLDLRLHFVEPKTSRSYKENKEEENMNIRKQALRKLKRSRQLRK